MELTPQALHDVEFREARRGGYNTRDVDDFLERIAAGISQLQDRLREAYHRGEAAEARLGEMQRQVDELQRRGPEGPSDADETLRRTLVLAQRTADATIKEAKDEANHLLSEAREEAARTRAAAESDARRDAKAEIEQLASSREALLQDIEAIERHLDEQRSRLRSGIGELQQLLDDPSALRSKPAPKVSEVPNLGPSAPAEPAPAPAFADSPPPFAETSSPFADVSSPFADAGAAFGHDLSSSGGRLTSNGGSPNEPEPVGLGRSSTNDGSMVAALQELPRRESAAAMDAGPPTEPLSFPPSTPSGTTGFLPDLRSAFEPPAAVPDGPLDDLSLPMDAPPPPPPPPGLDAFSDVGGIPIEPGSRPSEWGRGVFDTEEDGSGAPRFGRHR